MKSELDWKSLPLRLPVLRFVGLTMPVALFAQG